MVAADYTAVGTTPFSSAITKSNWAYDYNSFALNADGKSAISKSGVSKFSILNGNFDGANVSPSVSSASDFSTISMYFSEASGTSQDPKLSVTYTGGNTISGTIYSDINKSGNVGSGVPIAVTSNGGGKLTGVTGANGTFSLSGVEVVAGKPITVFVDGGPFTASLVTVPSSAADISGLEMFVYQTVLKNESGISAITNADLAIADDCGCFSDFSVSGSTLSGYQLYIPAGATYTPGGDISGTYALTNYGTVNMGSSNISVYGFYQYGGTFNAGSGTHSLGNAAFTSGTFNANTSNLTLTNYQISMSGGTFNGNTATITMLDATFAMNGGIFNASSGTMTITTDSNGYYNSYQWNVTGGTFNHNNGTVKIGNLYNCYYGSSISFNNVPTFYNLTYDNSSSGYMQTNANIIVLNNMTMGQGYFSPGNITIGGNLVGSSGFSPYTATFNDVTKTSQISGSNYFYTFNCTTPGKTLQFLAGDHQTIYYDMNVVGTSGSPIVMTKYGNAAPINQWFFYPNEYGMSPWNIDYVTVSYSNNQNSTPIAPTHWTDVSNNTNWTGSHVTGTAYQYEGGPNVGSGTRVSLSVDGGTKQTVYTNSNGVFDFVAGGVTSGTKLTIFFESYQNYSMGNTVTVASGSGDITGLTLYPYQVVLTTQSGTPITNADLAVADNCGDSQLIFNVDNSNSFHSYYSINIPATKTYSPGTDAGVGVYVYGANVYGTINAGPTFISYDMNSFYLNSGGTFNAGSGSVTIAGLYITGGTFNANTSTLLLNGYSFYQSNGAFNSNTATITIQCYNFSMSGGTFVAPAGTLTLDANNVPTDFYYSAAAYSYGYDANGGTVLIKNIADGYNYHLSGNMLWFYNLTADSTHGVIVTDSNLHVNNNLTISGESVQFNAGSYDLDTKNYIQTGGYFYAPHGTMSVSGNFYPGGHIFSHSYGTVNFDGAGGTTQIIGRGVNFYNLTMTTTVARTINFGNLTNFIVDGWWTATGTAGNQLTLGLNGAGTQWGITPSTSMGNQWTVDYVTVSNSINYATPPISPAHWVDAGNNTNWDLVHGCVWDGGGSDNNWSTAANWTLDTLPTAACDVVFDSTSTKASTLDSGFTAHVKSLSINAGYTNTLTLGRDLNDDGALNLAAGTLSAGNYTLNIGGSWNNTGGTFTKGTSTVNFNSTSASTVASNNNDFYNVTVAGQAAAITTPYVWVSNYGGGNVSKIDTSNGSKIGDYTAGANSYGVAVDNAGYAWVGNISSNTVSKFDIINGSKIGDYATGNNPRGVAIDANGFVWVANYLANTVSKINSATGAKVGDYNAGASPYAVAVDNAGYVWVTNYNSATVTKINAATGVSVGSYSVGTYPWGITFDGNGYIWVANNGANTISKIDISNGAKIGDYNVNSPTGLAADGNGFIWVANCTDSVVSKINASTGAKIADYATGSWPSGVSVDANGFVWVANGTAHTISKINATTGVKVADYATGTTPYSPGDATGFALKKFVLGGGGVGSLSISDSFNATNNLNISSGSLSNGANSLSGGNVTVFGGTLTGGTGNISAGNFTQSGGTVTAPSTSLNISGNFNYTSGTFTHSSGTVTFNGTASGKTVTSTGVKFNNVTVNGAGGVWTLQNDMTLAGNMTLTAGALAASNKTINLAGSWINNGGTFDKGTSTVNLNGSSATTITSNNQQFYNLTDASQSVNAASLGDDFSGSSIDASKWAIYGVDSNNTAGISSGKLAFSSSSFGGGPTIGSNYTLTGDYDIQVDYDLSTTSLPDTNYLGLYVYSNGYQFAIRRTYYGEYQYFIYKGGAIVDNSTSEPVGKLRVIRSGSVQTFKKWSGGAWVTVNYQNNVSTDPTTYSLFFYNPTNRTEAATMDNFKINSGTIVNAPNATSTLSDNLSVSNTMIMTSGTFNSGANTITTGTYAQTGGVFNAPSTNMYVSGDFNHASGTFTHSSGTVNLSGAGGSTQNISGDTAFNNLSATGTSARTISFATGSTQTIAGTWTATGAASQLLTLTGSSNWNINPTAWNVSYVNAVNSTNLASSSINPTHSVNGGNTVNWFPVAVYHTITSSVNGLHGSISPLGATQVLDGADQGFTITPDQGYAISGIKIDNIDQSAPFTSPYTFTSVTTDHTIEVTFAASYMITASVSGANGTISPLGDTTVLSAGTQAYTITPSNGYHITDIKIDGTSQTGTLTSPYTFTNVVTNHTIAVSFGVDGTCIWDGGAGDNNWSSADNWTGNTVPSSSCDIIFDATSTKASTIDAGFAGTIKTLTMSTGYTNTITQSRNITVTSVLTIGAGTFDASNKTMTLSGSSTPLVITSGIFNANTSTVEYAGNTATNIASTTFYNLNINHSSTIFTPIGDMTISNILTISNGILNGSSRIITLSGTTGTPFVNNGSFNTDTSTIIYTGNYSSGPTNVLAGNYYNLTLNNASETYLATGNLNIGNVLTISAGTLDAADKTITFNNTATGTPFVKIGTFSPSTSTVVYAGNYTVSSTNIASATYYNLTIDNNNETFVLAGDIIVNNNLVSSSNTNCGDNQVTTKNLTVLSIFTAPSTNLNISGDFSHPSGQFNTNSGTVNLIGAGGSTQNISNNTTFYNLSATGTLARTINFAAGSTQTVSGTWTATGAADQLLTLTGSSTWSINPTAWNVDYVNVVKSTNLASSKINPTHYTDGGGTTNWFLEIPSAASGVNLDTLTTTGFTVKWTDNSSNETGFKVYTAVATPDCANATYSGTPDYTTAANAVSQVITSKAINTQYCAKVVATNTDGDAAAGFASPKYTLANIPTAPTVSTPTTTSLKVVINQNSNPSNTTYAIKVVQGANTNYLNTNGTLSVSPVFETYTNFGGASGVTNTGLAPNTSYTYSVAARNGDLTETVYGSAASLSTSANSYTLTYNHDSNGTITGSTPQTVTEGANGTQVTAVPNSHYHFVKWSDDVMTAARTDLNITNNITVTATFAIDTYTLTYNNDGNGSITGTTPQTVDYGANGTQVTAVPNSHYHFVKWSDDVMTAARTDLNVTANITVTATFAIDTYTLTYNAGSHGSVSGVTPQTVNYGANGGQVLAVPDANYHFVKWSDDVMTAARIDQNITANLTVTATFAINTYTLTYNASLNGSITGTTPQTVDYGTNGTQVTAVPNSHYHFVSWSDGVLTAARTDSNITADITVTATFAIDTYTLTYNAGSNGSITGTTPQTINYGANSTQVTAVPSAHYHFVSWSDNVLTAARTDLNVTANITVTATFAINTYTLTYNNDGNGSVTGTNPQTINYGANGTQVTAVPSAHYHFVSWSDNVLTAARTDLNVTANITVTATFAINTYTLTYNNDGNGSVTGTNPQTINYGANGTQVTAVPSAHYHFVKWSDDIMTAARTDLNVTDNITVTATFAIDTYTLTYSAGANGSITGTTPQTVNYGASGTQVTAVPAANYHFVKWSDDVMTAARTDSNITANISVTATFAIDTYTLTYSAGANGSITGITPQTVNYGGNGSQVTAVPSAHYHFVSWSDGVLTAARTDSNITADVTVTATFAIDTYTLTYNAGSHGSVSGVTPQTVNYGANGGQVLAVPDDNYHFVKWSDDVMTAARIDQNITSDLTVSATFAINSYTLTYSAGSHGSITGTTPQTVNYGGSGSQVTAVPDSNYHFVKWSDNVMTAARTDSSVSNDITVTATFAINTYTLTYNHDSNGTIVGITPQTVGYGANGSEVIATPNTNYHFVKWSDDVMTAARTDLDITADITVTATFAVNTYTLTYSAGANGSITGITPQTVNYGANGTQVTAVPNLNYHFTTWSDGVLTAARTDLNVTGNITVTANFAAENQYTLSYTAGSHGTISGNASQTVYVGGDGTQVVAIPDTNYHFVKWSDNVMTAARTDLNITTDITVTADFAINTYTLTYNAGSNGSITGTTSQTVGYGSNGAQVTAVPAANYHFVKWSDNVMTAARTDLNVTDNITVTATFAINTYTLTYNAGSNGSITGTTPQTVNYGGNGSQVTAVPSAHYHFVSWSDGVLTEARTDSNITSNLTVSATFAIDTNNITASAGTNGSISPTGVTAINYGSNRAYTITANDNFHVLDVLVDGVSVGSVTTYTFNNVTTSHTISATFIVDTKTITALAGSHGSIDPDGATTVNYGSNQAYTILPSSGYHIEDVLVDSVSVGSVSNYTFTTVTTNHTISASFSANPVTPTGTSHTITATINAHGTVSPSGSTLVDDGSSQIYTITPDAGYYIEDLKIDGVSVGALATYTFSNVTTDHTIAATIAVTTYTITASSGNGGSITPSGSIIVDALSNKTFTISANSGYFIRNVQVDGVSKYDLETYTFSSITANHTIEVTFGTYPASIDNPINFSGVAGNGQVELTWTNPSSTYFKSIDIYRSLEKTVQGVKLATGQTGTSYTDSNLTNGVTYYYTLKAIDSLGHISSGTEQLALTPTNVTDNEGPTAPTNLRATVIKSTEISLAWDASTDNVGVTGYKIFNADTDVMIGTTSNTDFDLTQLTPETVYNFYIKAYDAAGNTSLKSSILNVSTKKGDALAVQAYLVLDNTPDKINAGQTFNDKVKVSAVDNGGARIQSYLGEIYFTSSDKKAELIWNSDHKYTFSASDTGTHSFDGSDFTLNTVGDQKLTVTDGQIQQNVQIKVIGNGVTSTLQKTQDQINSLFANISTEGLTPEAKSVSNAVIVTTSSLLAAPIVLNAVLATANIWPQLLYLLSHLFQFLGIRKRRKPWGTVFNSQTGQAIPYALIKIFDKEYNRLLETAVSDGEGRFGFLVRTGKYYLTVQKNGYTFPSVMKVSGFFDSVYTGEVLEIDSKDKTVTINVPMDAQTKLSFSYKLLVFTIKLNRILNTVRIVLLVLGIMFAIVLMIISINIFYIFSLIFYILIAIWEYLRTKRARPYGVVTDIFGRPLETTIVRIYEKRTNRLVETDVTDIDGRFKFLVNPGIYYLTATKPEYTDFKSHIMYLEKEKTLVSVNIKMKKIN
ncbi:MAG: InlB B-repeat-containing protein [Candidatus Berkelbacteria bacterium]